MKINMKQNLIALNNMNKVKTGTIESLPKESVTIGQTEKFDDMKAMRDMTKEPGKVKADRNELSFALRTAGVFVVSSVIAGAVGGGMGYLLGGGQGAIIGMGIGTTAGLAGIMNTQYEDYY